MAKTKWNTATFFYIWNNTLEKQVSLGGSTPLPVVDIIKSNQGTHPLMSSQRDKEWFTPCGTWLHPRILTRQWCWQRRERSSSEKVRDHFSFETWLTLTGETILTYILQASKTRGLACRHCYKTTWTDVHMHGHSLHLLADCLNTQQVHTVHSDSEVLPGCSQKKNPLEHIISWQAEFLLHVCTCSLVPLSLLKTNGQINTWLT